MDKTKEKAKANAYTIDLIANSDGNRFKDQKNNTYYNIHEIPITYPCISIYFACSYNIKNDVVEFLRNNGYPKIVLINSLNIVHASKYDIYFCDNMSFNKFLSLVMIHVDDMYKHIPCIINTYRDPEENDELNTRFRFKRILYCNGGKSDFYIMDIRLTCTKAAIKK